MEDAGFWAALPPLLAIVLALITKDVIVSVFFGIASGAIIWSGGNPFTAFLHLTDLMADKVADGWNARIMLFCGLLGGLVGLLSRAGAARAFGKWTIRFIKGRKSAQLFAWFFGLLIFIDDYFNSLAVGSVMRPVTDSRNISRAKLAYILDSTAAPICILAPISSWVVTVISQIRASAGFADLGVGEMSFFVMLIPYNLYAVFALLMVFMVAVSGRDFGPMAESERRAMAGELFDERRYGPAPGRMEESGEPPTKAAWYDMALLMVILLVACVVAFPVSSYTAAEPGEAMGLLDAFRNADASKALFYGIIFTLAVAYTYFILRGTLSIKTASDALIEGIKSMIPALVILVLAWTIGHIISRPISDGGLGLPLVIDQALRGSVFPLWLLPLALFAISGAVAFSTGTSWGTFGIMIPIALPLSMSLASSQGLAPDASLQATLVSVGAVLSGAVFGDHTSPISDTTILSSAGGGCPHLEHVATQMPYAAFVAAVSAVGVAVAGFSLNPWAALGVTLAVFLPTFFLITKKAERKAGKE